jgi:hypothetical protein
LRRADVSIAQVQAALALASRRLRQQYTSSMAERSLVATDLKAWLFGANRRYFNLLMIVAALLSAIIAANLINLLLGQLTDRTPYFATAQALGTEEHQLLKPLFLEHLVLCARVLAAGAPRALAYRHLLVATLGPAGLTLPATDAGVLAVPGLAATPLLFFHRRAGRPRVALPDEWRRDAQRFDARRGQPFARLDRWRRDPRPNRPRDYPPRRVRAARA